MTKHYYFGERSDGTVYLDHVDERYPPGREFLDHVDYLGPDHPFNADPAVIADLKHQYDTEHFCC